MQRPSTAAETSRACAAAPGPNAGSAPDRGGLGRLFAQLDCWLRPIPQAALRRYLQRLRVPKREYTALSAFDPACYRRNRLHVGPYYEALILCWRSGQRSPIHNHAGSACGVRVLQGVASETIFEMSSCGLVYPVRTRHLTTGSVTASFGADTHQMGNLQPAGIDLITLHIYSPPLRFMQFFYLGDAVIGEAGDVLAGAIAARRVRGRPGAIQRALFDVRLRAKQPAPRASRRGRGGRS